MSTSSPHDRPQSKAEHEMDFWRGLLTPMLSDPVKLADMGKWYEYFYTEFFGLTKADFAGKRMLDIGCGPMGSIEWADNAAERIGLDPLAAQYRDLVRDHQKMQYCAAPAERIPFPDAHFDCVSTFNSLDHVDDVAQVIAEIKRVVKPSGRILLIVEINHDATPTEPHRLDEGIVRQFAPPFTAVNPRRFGIQDQYDLYGALKKGVPYKEGEVGLLACRFEGRS